MKHLIPYAKYRKFPAINYSLLSNVDRNPSSLNQPEEKESTAMNKGSLVDVLLTSPDLFKKDFYLMKGNKLTASTYTLYKELITRLPKFSLEAFEKEAFKVIKDLKLWSTTRDPEVLKKKIHNKDLISNLKDFYNSKSKTQVYPQEYESCKELVNELKTHSFTRGYFTADKSSEILFQVPIVFEHNGIKYKILLDGILIDKWNKTFTPFDLKTSEDSARAFPSKIYRWRYDIQASLYSIGAEIFRQANFPDYESKDFTFVVGSFNSPTRPLLYNAKALLNIGEYGGTLQNGRVIRGFRDLTEDYFWHLENDLWEYSKEAYTNNGIINLTE
tara:strand:+ start:3300 stop:4289 length:990 start_codon:yes stop_codon:yes gene_type:complete